MEVPNRSPVLEVTDYYDGIRDGRTELGGVEYRFVSRRLDTVEYHGDYESVDIFDLHPINSSRSDVLIATGVFFVTQVETPGVSEREFEVEWSILNAPAA